MVNFVLVGVGGALGALARYAVDQASTSYLGSSLVGTFVANVSGSFFLGFLVGILSSHLAWPDETRIFLAVGFIGSYTTFSTLTVSTIQLLEKGEFPSAVGNLVASILIGLVAAITGMVFGRAL